MKIELSILKAIEFLLGEKYRSEFQVIDGLSQHPEGFNFYDWLRNKGLISSDEYVRINMELRKEAEAERALNEIQNDELETF